MARATRHRRGAFTLVEAVVLAAVVVILSVVVVLMLTVARERANRRRCLAHLGDIGRAAVNYMGMLWFTTSDPAHPYPTDALAGHYGPRYSSNLRTIHELDTFACPSTRDRPEVWHGTIDGDFQSWFGTAAGRATTGPLWTSYGFDAQVGPYALGRAGASDMVVVGDMDASFASGGATSNHRDGGNFLYSDGHVAWRSTVYCSADPLDNIFADDGWGAETDSYLRRP